MLDTPRAVIPVCWTASLREVCFVHLGKYGDIMIMLPAFKKIADELGKPTICMVSNDFATIFDGVSYVRPWPVGLNWWKEVGKAKKMALDAGLDPIVVKWWDELGAVPPTVLEPGKTIVLKIHGTLRRIAANDWDSFQASQWRYAGFTMDQMMEWPLVFDRRSPEREEDLCRKHLSHDRPQMLVNLSKSGTSPFKEAGQVGAMLMGHGFNIVNLAGIRAHRIYDLLGLYDRATLLVTSDTSTLHLAAASNIPYIAFLNNGGAGSIPRGNCVLSIRYSEVGNKMGLLLDTIKKYAPEKLTFPRVVAHA